MVNRAANSWALKLGSVLLGLIAGAAGANLRAAEPAKTDCTTCHDQGQKLVKSAHAALTCDTCHEQHDQYPHPPNVESRPA